MLVAVILLASIGCRGEGGQADVSQADGSQAEAQLYGVVSLDPTTLATATLLILAAALAAAWLPAHRATRIDPTIAIRDPSAT